MGPARVACCSRPAFVRECEWPTLAPVAAWLRNCWRSWLVQREKSSESTTVPHQVEQARALLPAGVSNVSFVNASATDTGLPRDSFDLVYSRFLLIHLTQPELALREMHGLLKPDGVLVIEDGDLTTAGSEPPSSLQAFSSLFGRLGPTWGVDYTLGRRLFQMVLATVLAFMPRMSQVWARKSVVNLLKVA